jgi:hypothetical protein
MPERRSQLLPWSFLLASVVVLSGCAALESLGLGGANTEAIIDTSEPAVETETTGENPDGEAPASATGFVLPTCDNLYSSAQNSALLDQVRVNIGDTSDGNFGFGTTNRELVSVLQNVRTDLRISCTWYLPASESVSVTSLAIIDPEGEASVSRILGATTASSQSVGGGTLWTIDSTTSDESSEYIATEAHFMAPVECPSSLAQTSCIAWFSTNYSFGQAETLTVDAARNLGVYTN